MSDTKPRSIADIDAELWNHGPLLNFAYLYDFSEILIRPKYRKKVSPQLLEAFADRVKEAQGKKLTGRPKSDALGELGEFFAAIMFGIKLHAPGTQGSDGKLGNEYVEVKTITPIKKRDIVQLKRTGNFSRIVVVKITNDFQFGARMVDRRVLGKDSAKQAYLSWDDMIHGAGERALEMHRNFPIIWSIR